MSTFMCMVCKKDIFLCFSGTVSLLGNHGYDNLFSEMQVLVVWVRTQKE